MNNRIFLTISEFSELTGIKRTNLIFYDQIGLLKPAKRAENNYRYYNRKQLDYAYLITSLRELGISIEQIKEYAQNRTPAQMISLFEQQETFIMQEIEKLNNLHDIMQIHTKAAKAALSFPSGTILIKEKEAEPILNGSAIAAGQPEDDAMIAFYNLMNKKEMALGYPLGTIVAKSNLFPGSSFPASSYYFCTGRKANNKKPEGLYALIYGCCAFGQAVPVYEELFSYLEKHCFYICGDAYEEYPLNELSIQNEEEYRVKIEIPIKLSP